MTRRWYRSRPPQECDRVAGRSLTPPGEAQVVHVVDARTVTRVTSTPSTSASVVSFDLDETLWEFLPMMDGALRATLAGLEERRPDLRGAVDVAELHQGPGAGGG